MQIKADNWRFTVAKRFSQKIVEKAKDFGYIYDGVALVPEYIGLNKKGSNWVNWKLDIEDIIYETINKRVNLKWRVEKNPEDLNSYDTARLIYKRENIYITIWLDWNDNIGIILEDGDWDDIYGYEENRTKNLIIAKKGKK